MSDLKSKILEMAAEDLAAIEDELKANLTPYLDIVSEAAGHILFSGGKRIRPLLLVLCARLCSYSDNYDKTFSVVFEYMHAASLLHDDVVDGATLRRGKPVANAIFGNAPAVLVGDYLLSRSVSIASKANQVEVFKELGKITEDMSQGELHQLIRKGCIDLSEEEYMEVIRRKTATLIQGACRIGAMIAHAPDEKRAALSDFGLHLGLAFQMADDLLDYTSDTTVLGKEVGADLREGKVTLPLIHALKKASISDLRQMKAIIQNTDFSLQDFEDLKGLLETYGGITYTQALAADHVARAKEALTIFSPSETRDLLSLLAEYTLARKV